MEKFTYNDEGRCLVYDNWSFPLSKKIEGKWSVENRFIISSLVDAIMGSGTFLSYMMSKHPCVDGTVSLVMFLLPAIIDFYHTEEYTKGKVKNDVHTAIVEYQQWKLLCKK